MPAGLKPGQKALVGAGRQKGTPNKDKTALRDAIAAACGPDWDPVVEMAIIAQTGLQCIYDPTTNAPAIDPVTGLPIKIMVDAKIRAMSRKEVSEYIHAKRKAVEVSGPDGDPFEITMHNDVKALQTMGAMLDALGTE
jgi:hypothetical protein